MAITAAPAQRTAAPARPAPSNADWQTQYTTRLRLSDLLVLVLVVYGTQIIWFGVGQADLEIAAHPDFNVVSYWAFSAVLIVAWMLALGLADSRDPRVVGSGLTEYARVVQASLGLFGLMAIAAYLTHIEIARGFVLISLPSGILMLIVERFAWRRWLERQRRRGAYVSRALLVGSRQSVTKIALELHRSSNAEYRVIGACIPHSAMGDVIPGTDIPVMGSVTAIERALSASGADTVIITSTDELPPDKVKQISWNLEVGRQHLVIAPSIADIAGPRIHARPVAGLPLIHVETPHFSGAQKIAKRAVDVGASALFLLLAAPVMLVLAIGIVIDDRGPVFFRQTRVGLEGRTFRMLKFRSMVVDAEARLAALSAERDAGNSVLFKMKSDPRVTGIGRFMRRYSLDELPQLLNVLGGSMSLIGPRPPLPSEVEQYADHVHRRFLVKPGITGLWQVSGRSSLSWEESVRLDLSYVENWSASGDFVILLKTARAALAPGETAY